MRFRREGVPMGLPGLDEWHIQQTDADAVRAAKTALAAIKAYTKKSRRDAALCCFAAINSVERVKLLFEFVGILQLREIFVIQIL